MAKKPSKKDEKFPETLYAYQSGNVNYFTVEQTVDELPLDDKDVVKVGVYKLEYVVMAKRKVELIESKNE